MNKTMSALIASLVSSCREKDLSGGICLNTANAFAPVWQKEPRKWV